MVRRSGEILGHHESYLLSSVIWLGVWSSGADTKISNLPARLESNAMNPGGNAPGAMAGTVVAGIDGGIICIVVDVGSVTGLVVVNVLDAGTEVVVTTTVVPACLGEPRRRAAAKVSARVGDGSDGTQAATTPQPMMIAAATLAGVGRVLPAAAVRVVRVTT